MAHRNVNSRTKLIDYCLRRLGHPVIEINVDDDQLEDRIDDGLQLFREYAADGSVRVYFPVQITQAHIDNKKINITMLASGSEVNLALKISHKLAKEKIYSKVISMPCQEIFDKQNQKYKGKILNETSKIFSIEAGSDQSWSKYINNKGLSFSINDFGKSAPYKKIYDHFGLNVEKICKKIKLNIKKNAS